MCKRKRHARDARGVWTQNRHVWIYVSRTGVLVRILNEMKQN